MFVAKFNSRSCHATALVKLCLPPYLVGAMLMLDLSRLILERYVWASRRPD
jgi:hypothetical protein